LKTNQTIYALRLELDLEAIARREGVSVSEVKAKAGQDPAAFVRSWIEKHYFETGGF
jgi:hypothetical protein